jgi:hypothetical protein
MGHDAGQYGGKLGVMVVTHITKDSSNYPK